MSTDNPGIDPLDGLRAPQDPACDVFLTGTVFLDIVFTGLDSAPVRGTESWARGMGSSPGGVANMATALARLGLRTSLAAAFGDDHYGEYCWDALEQGEGIDLSMSRTVRGWHSPVTVSMAYEGERTMVSHGHEAPPPATGRTGPSRTARRAPAPPSPHWPPAAANRGWPPRPGTAPGSSPMSAGTRPAAGTWTRCADLEHCEAFLPNAEEAMRYTRTDCPRAAARALAERVPLAVVTLGAEGAYAVDAATGETAEVPAIEVEALDPTGAGDVFVAGFVTGTLAGLAAGRPARLRRTDRGALRAGVRRVPVGARLGGDRRLVAAGPHLRRPGSGGAAAVRLPGGPAARGRPALAAAPGRTDDRLPQPGVTQGHAGTRVRHAYEKALGVVRAESYAW